jgi:hypothetical protein
VITVSHFKMVINVDHRWGFASLGIKVKMKIIGNSKLKFK